MICSLLAVLFVLKPLERIRESAYGIKRAALVRHQFEIYPGHEWRIVPNGYEVRIPEVSSEDLLDAYNMGTSRAAASPSFNDVHFNSDSWASTSTVK